MEFLNLPFLVVTDTYVMKLFDRSVDLAQFDEDDALYPVCRAWLKNQPHNRSLGTGERTPTPEPEPPTNSEEEVQEALSCLGANSNKTENHTCQLTPSQAS